jgi:hypothetical protein
MIGVITLPPRKNGIAAGLDRNSEVRAVPVGERV